MGEREHSARHVERARVELLARAKHGDARESLAAEVVLEELDLGRAGLREPPVRGIRSPTMSDLPSSL